MRDYCPICEEDSVAIIKGLKIRKEPSPTGVMSDMMNISGGLGTM